jgi:hypothetical protein
LFAFIGFPHAEYVTIRATRCVSNDDHSPGQRPVANDALFAVLFARVFDLKGNSREHDFSIPKVEPSFHQSLVTLGWIECDTHGLL